MITKYRNHKFVARWERSAIDYSPSAIMAMLIQHSAKPKVLALIPPTAVGGSYLDEFRKEFVLDASHTMLEIVFC